jgi:glycine/D-amino acid oxidase-like deaminating enzyme
MESKDFLIVGAGLCGTWLAYFLSEENCSFDIIDNHHLGAASLVAGGIVNPVTGRRVVTVWLDEQIMPFLAGLKQKKVISEFIEETSIISFPGSQQMEDAYRKRMTFDNRYLMPAKDSNAWRESFRFYFQPVQIKPCYIFSAERFISQLKKHWELVGNFHSNFFNETALLLSSEGVTYNGRQYKKVIYSNGFEAVKSRFWSGLPFVANKGQALILSIPALHVSYMFKFGSLTLVPLGGDKWWCGSSNELNFDDGLPNLAFRKEAVQTLTQLLEVPFEVLDHVSAVRPATIDRRPFVGVHPLFHQIAILNGMGSKGCSLAPWFAHELVQHLLHGRNIHAEADVAKYGGLLRKL